MDRREAFKASLLGAAALSISGKSAYAAESEAAQASSAETRSLAATDLPLVSVSDYEAAAKQKLSVGGWEYFNGGSADEITLQRNRSALDGLQLKPRVLVDVTQIDTSCELLGYKLEHPILLAPTSSHQLAHPDAEVATAMGAAAAKAILVASTNSNRSIEDICKAAARRSGFSFTWTTIGA